MAGKGKVPLVVRKPAVPSTSLKCPPGLEYLAVLDQLIVQQQVELLEAFVPVFETANKYVVKNSMGQFIYLISEDSNICVRMCCGPQRCLEMGVQDYRGQEVMRIIRPCRCTSCFCPCCLQAIEVQAPPGTTIAHVNQDWSICFPSFTVSSRTGNALVKVKGPFCTESLPCCCDVNFRFLSVSARLSPTNWSHDNGAVFFWHPDDNLHPANHWSTAPSCPGIKFIENLVHTTS